MSRLLLGQHPQGPLGLFISKPGVNVESVGAADTNNLLFSSEWGSIASIIQSGVTRLNQDVVFPFLGYLPYIRLEEKVGNSYNYGTAAAFTQSVGVGQTRRYTWTRYRVAYQSSTTFRAVAWRPEIDAGDPNQEFRYVIINCAANM